MEEKTYTVKSFYNGLSLLADFLRQIPHEQFKDIEESCNIDCHQCATKDKRIGLILEKMMEEPRKQPWWSGKR